MTSPSLTEFLLARIAEDEAVAAEAARHQTGRVADPWALSCDYAKDDGLTGWILADPARVLAQCEARRAIVGLAQEQPSLFEEALRWHAEVYADHPDYDEAWRA